MTVNSSKKTTISDEEILHFAKDSASWWEEDGPFAPLHRLNPVRLGFIKSEICSHFSRENNNLRALEGLKILDIGCGGGLVCEPLSRLGAAVTGVDADQNAIGTAKTHAEQNSLNINYECGDAADLKDKFDVVLALEIIEHVNAIDEFFEICTGKLKPDGLLIFSTLNRTKKSYLLGILAAEYILRWVPRGTHTWQKFVKPSELARLARKKNMIPIQTKGIIFNPLLNMFALSQNDLDVNYIMSFKADKP